jgi:hypothetical protein
MAKLAPKSEAIVVKYPLSAASVGVAMVAQSNRARAMLIIFLFM